MSIREEIKERIHSYLLQPMEMNEEATNMIISIFEKHLKELLK